MPAFGFELAKELAFYGAYHTHPMNQLIHLMCIPALFWSWCIALCSIYATTLPGGLLDSVPVVTPGLALWAFYATYYALLDPVGGTLTGAIYLAIYLSAAWFTAQGAGAFGLSVLGVAAAVQALGWIVQIGPGHGFFERRKPALADSFVQAFLLGPLFVWLEVFFLLGYRPKLQREVQRMVDKQLAAWGATTRHSGDRASSGRGATESGGGAAAGAAPRRARRRRAD